MNTCDTLKEGFLNNPRQCKVGFSKLLCAEGKDDNTCLTAPQLKTVDTFYGGVKNSKDDLKDARNWTCKSPSQETEAK